MASFFIDESSGIDGPNSGTQESPYKSLSFAVFMAGAEGAKYLIRKDGTSEYDEPTKSSLKKAVKDAEGIAKKRKKAEEAATLEETKNRAEREKRERLLEDSKQIVLVENEELPKAIKVSHLNAFYFHALNLFCVVDQDRKS